MKYILIILLTFVFACSVDVPRKTVSAGVEGEEPRTSFGLLAIHCLRNFLIGEDSGGEWTIIEKPGGSTLLQSDLDGTDNPCIDFDEFGCGVYRLQYKVTEPCCIDSTTIRINKRCCTVEGVLNCN